MNVSQRLTEIRTGFERPFWVANISELFERLSYYAAFASLARYLHEALDFPTERASGLSGLFGGLVWFLAIFGGAIADRLGFPSCSLACLSHPCCCLFPAWFDWLAVAGARSQCCSSRPFCRRHTDSSRRSASPR